MKHNYPANRRSYIPTNSQKYELIQEHGLEKIREEFIKGGMYYVGDKYKVSPKVIWHLAHDLGWKRPLPSHLKTAIKNGCWKLGKCHYWD